MLELQFAAKQLAYHCGYGKQWNISHFYISECPQDKNKRYWYMNVEKPSERVSCRFCPCVAKGQIKKKGKYEQKYN